MSAENQPQSGNTTNDWREGPGGNLMLDGEGFHISYQDFKNSPFGPTSFGPDGDQPETALCKDGNYYILNGDYRSAYENLLSQGFEACLNFFQDNASAHKSSWSD